MTPWTLDVDLYVTHFKQHSTPLSQFFFFGIIVFAQCVVIYVK
jgi:hypothetical protein